MVLQIVFLLNIGPKGIYQWTLEEKGLLIECFENFMSNNGRLT
jgi:hypothetical protein